MQSSISLMEEVQYGKLDITWAFCILQVTYNFKFGGIQEGWMGEMSVPITSVFGLSSAKSLCHW